MITSSLKKALASGLEGSLRDMNPWWQGAWGSHLPPTRRWAFQSLRAWLKTGLTKVTVLRGPRQVGKTTVLEQIILALLQEGIAPHRIFRVQFDSLPPLKKIPLPILELSRWYSEAILGQSFHQAAESGQPCYLFFDELQNLVEWSSQLKQLVDLHPIRVMATGSSALRIAEGRDSLAGRIYTFEMGPLLLREIAQFQNWGSIPPFMPPNGLSPLKQKEFWQELRAFGEQHRELRRKTFATFSARGAYPLAHLEAEQQWERTADLLNETVIQRVLQHDLRQSKAAHKSNEHLLESIFRFTCRYAGQTPTPAFYTKQLTPELGEHVTWRQAARHLKLLDGAMLLRLIEPLEIRLRRRQNIFKLCLCDHALRAAWLQEVIPLSPEELQSLPHLTDLAGHLAESVAGYFLSAIPNLEVTYFPGREREPEVDFVLTVGEQRIPVEVKYRRRIALQDTHGLRVFMEKAHFNAPFGLLVTLFDDAGTDNPRVVSMPLSTLLLLR